MADKPSAEEFRSFIRDLGVRAFDQLASHFTTASDAVAEGSERLARRAGSLSMMAGYWSNLKLAEKEQFFEQMIAAAQTVATAAPAIIGLRGLRKKRAAEPGEVTPEPSRKKKKSKKKKRADDLDLAGDFNADLDSPKKKKKKKKKS